MVKTVKSITYSTGNMDDMYKYGPEICKRHWEETAKKYFKEDLNIDFDMYAMADTYLDSLMVIKAQLPDGDLIGYLIGFVTKYKYLVHRNVATFDLLYVDKRFRKMGIFEEMMKFGEEVALNKGADFVCVQPGLSKQLTQKFQEKLGYTPFEVTVAKMLKKED